MLQTIPIINNKGGVGKTTTCVNVAGGLARRGDRVLLVDLDSQGSASLSLGVDHEALRPSAADALFDDVPVRSLIRETSIDGLDLMTGSLDLADADVRLKRHQHGHLRLRSVLDAVTDTYDRILIDCPPSTSMVSVNALVAADAFIIPVSPSYLALEGVVSLGNVVRRVRRGLGRAAPVLGIVITRVQRDDAQTGAIIQQLRDHYGGKVFDTQIPSDPALEEAPGYDQDAFAYAPDAPGTDAYRSLLDEIEDRIDRYGAVYDNVLAHANASLDATDLPTGT